MDPGRVDHMLPHIVNANIHNLHSVQRGPSQLRRAGGMGRNSMERKEHPEICQKARFPHRFIRRVGMPGQGRVAILKIAVADQIRLSSGILFRRAAIIADRSRKLLLLHIRL